jgi:hypothetical protein
MRPLIKFFLNRTGKDRSHLYKALSRANAQSRSEISLILGVVLYELVELAVRKKREELCQTLLDIKALERKLKEMKII